MLSNLLHRDTKIKEGKKKHRKWTNQTENKKERKKRKFDYQCECVSSHRFIYSFGAVLFVFLSWICCSVLVNVFELENITNKEMRVKLNFGTSFIFPQIKCFPAHENCLTLTMLCSCSYSIDEEIDKTNSQTKRYWKTKLHGWNCSQFQLAVYFSLFFILHVRMLPSSTIPEVQKENTLIRIWCSQYSDSEKKREWKQQMKKKKENIFQEIFLTLVNGKYSSAHYKINICARCSMLDAICYVLCVHDSFFFSFFFIIFIHHVPLFLF